MALDLHHQILGCAGRERLRQTPLARVLCGPEQKVLCESATMTPSPHDRWGANLDCIIPAELVDIGGHYPCGGVAVWGLQGDYGATIGQVRKGSSKRQGSDQ